MLVTSIKRQLEKCPRVDLEQNILRVITVTSVIFYLHFMGVFEGSTHSAISISYTDVVIIVIATSCFFLSLLFYPKASVKRRILGMVFDFSVCTYGMIGADRLGAPLFFIYYWICIGNGIRWGVKYLYFATFFSLIGFGLVFLFTNYWQANNTLAVGVFFGLIVIPLFVARLIKRLNDATTEAKNANAAKSQFLANMSHEMRTPLTGILGFVDLMHKETLSPKLEKFVNHIDHSARNLRSIVNDVLDMSKVEAGEFSLIQEPVDIKKEIEAATASLQPLAKKKELNLVINVKPGFPDFALCDRTRLNQIISNLVGNAIKFTSSGEVRFTAEKTGYENNINHVRFTIEDTGVGISQNEISFVFEPFRQVETGFNRRYEGTGLGLSITKGIVDKMNGKISISSEPGEYTRITVDLPLVTTNKLPEDSRKLSENRLVFKVENLKALVVDDNEVNQEFIRELLDSHGFCTDVAVSGKDALRLCRDNAYQVVFMDIHMAEMDGIETTKRLIDMDLNQRPAVIAVTADVFGQKHGKFPLSYFDAILTKPVEEHSLLGAVKTIFPDNLKSGPDQEQLADTFHDPGILSSERGVMLASGNEELWRYSVMKVLDLRAEQMQSIRDAAGRGHYKKVRETAHRISGSASYVGADALAHCARELELFIIDNSGIDCQEKIDRLDREFDRLSSIFP